VVPTGASFIRWFSEQPLHGRDLADGGNQHRDRQQIPEPSDPLIELGFRWPQGQPVGDRAED
jgi:hypothetical protein